MRVLILISVLAMFVLSACGGGGSSSSSSGYSISGYVKENGVGLAGVKLVDGSNTTYTDSNGFYKFDQLGSHDYYITPSLFGYTFTDAGPSSFHVWVSNASIINNNFTATKETVFSIYGHVTGNGSIPGSTSH